MDWKSIAPLVGAVAPFAGKLLGGLVPFPGAALIGEQFGKIIARQFGVPETPAAVAAAISGSPNEVVLAKINQAIEVSRIEINGFVEIEKAYLHAIEVGLEQVGATMRGETAGRVQLALHGIREHWFYTAGRPASLWVFNAVSLCFGLMLTAATAKAAWTAPDPLNVLTEAWPLFASYFGPLCLVNGIYINARSGEKKTAIENAAPMPNAKPPIPTTGSGVKPATPPKPVPKFIPDPVGSR
jgi:hypothetical protein